MSVLAEWDKLNERCRKQVCTIIDELNGDPSRERRAELLSDLSGIFQLVMEDDDERLTDDQGQWLLTNSELRMLAIARELSYLGWKWSCWDLSEWAKAVVAERMTALRAELEVLHARDSKAIGEHLRTDSRLTTT